MVNDRVRRISVLKVPVDIIAPEDLEEVIKAMYSDGKNHQIILLSEADLMLARRSGEFRTMIAGASLVVPISASIIRTAKFLRRPVPVRYEPFDFIVRTLSILERWGKSAYLFGSGPKGLAKASKNIKATFPGLRVVGGHSARFQKSFHPKIVEAIRKAAPTLLLVGKGVPGGERWIPRNMKHFNSGLQLWCSDVFDVFAERKSRPPAAMFAKGLEWLFYLPARPWTAFRIFTAARLRVIALWYRLRRL
ncbi:MAG: WecB/TagA/CpsF family glycosyltransferase [Spirochaetes bacterium]|nr:WecB/TagA/CpsF family glycosyltransferase [Spirochaetota bacterium]MBU1081795.1 WecB/TagA/CpsF family glycosyltransferase [Spirochaetota bacterium]